MNSHCPIRPTMPFCLDEESRLVLNQIGYDRSVVDTAIEDYRNLCITYPDLVEPSKQGFILYFRAKYSQESAEVQKSLFGNSLWTPGYKEVKALEEEGYWREAISAAHVEWLCLKKGRAGQSISPFGQFRYFLRKQMPLPISIEDNWVPNGFLRRLIKETILLSRPFPDDILTGIVSQAREQSIKPAYLPRYCYQYFKDIFYSHNS